MIQERSLIEGMGIYVPQKLMQFYNFLFHFKVKERVENAHKFLNYLTTEKKFS
jgi:hypothetical protein